jgi:hypothetical protein
LCADIAAARGTDVSSVNGVTMSNLTTVRKPDTDGDGALAATGS